MFIEKVVQEKWVNKKNKTAIEERNNGQSHL